MNDRRENQITMKLREMKKQKWHVGLLVCLSLLVAAGVAGIFHLQATTKTYQVRELTCTAVPPTGEACADFFAHIHNDDCYDSNGHLVCPLPEIKPHRHTEDCYSTGRVLACGLPESDGHQHTSDCYTPVRGDLICELSTEPVLDEQGNVLQEGHVHTDECYEWRDELTCGMEEGQGAHHHDDSCYQTETTLTCDKPEIILHTHTDDCYLKDDDGNIYVDENGNAQLICGQVQVLEHVHGPECFTVHELDEEPDETDPEPAASGQFFFMDEENEDETEDGTDGTEPDEADETPEAADETGQTDEENGEPAEETTGEESDKEPGEETDPADGKTEESSPEEPLSVRMPAQNFEESTDTVTVRVVAPDGAFPPETTMRVTQIEIESVMGVVQESVGGEITRVQAVDISFFDADGNEIEPMVPIHVDMIPVANSGNDETEETAAAPDGSVQTILHVDNDGNTTVVEQKDGESTENSTVSFATDSFSVYILVYSNTLEKTVLASDGETYRITLSYDADAGIPADAELAVQEILPDTEEYKAYLQLAEDSVENEMVSFARFFDITILSGGQEIQPAAPVDVKIELADPLDEGAKAIHFGDEVEVIDASVSSLPGKTGYADEAENAGSETAFSADGFSVYGVIVTTLEKTITASDGNTYSVSVTYGADAKIPVDAELRVEEIVRPAQEEDSEETEAISSEYDAYLEKTAEALGLEAGSLPYARFFDITIFGAEAEKLQPAEGTTVAVSVQLLDRENTSTTTQVIHFGEEETEVLTNTVEGDTVAFEASSFSVYAIVDAPEPASIDSVKTLEELGESFNQEFYLSYNGNYYFTNALNDKDCFVETKIVAEASYWYFEKVEGQENRYYIYTFVDGIKQYMHNKSGNLMELSEGSKTAFDLSQATEGKFYFKAAGEEKWLQHSNGGGGIRFYTDNNNAVNSQIIITYATLPDDTYSLDGKSFGIAYHDDNVTSAALTAESKTVSGKQRLAGLDMVMKPDVLDNDGLLLVAQNSDIQMWTFESIEENRYHITTTVDGQKKYLTINGTDVTLEDTPDETNSVITATPGTESNSGKWHFTVNGYSMNLPNGSDNGFNAATGSGETTWMNLVEKSVLNDDDFTLYTAKKVSVSDTTNVYDGQQVVIYTRIWNETTKKYEFYAVDHDGSLVRCYDTGDNIEWIGSKVNTALWDFTEYQNTDKTPNYYYELQNAQYGRYIAPQVSGDQILSDNTIGINLSGRRYGEAYTTIIAWDDAQYAYSGLKTENGHVVSCALAEAEDFYFAVVNPIDPDDELSTVRTIDSTQYGITMRMIDFNNAKTGSEYSPRDSLQNPFFGGDNNKAGLLSNSLEGGYPTTTSATGNADHSLSELFSDMTDVNHLFIESIYNESGYFEYDSTSNFAHLNEDGTFTVYDQIGTIGDYNTNTGAHGQFMPYDELKPGKYCTFTNRTNVLAQELSDLDPRKGETLYNLGTRREVDYHFGMEMSASFTQTASGLDEWGHDIIFEFSGDDDFWFYVDGELVLDLGGVHSAMTGSINFRTGVVTSSRGNSTLYEIFKKNYQARGMSADEINTKLDEVFTRNAAGQYIFRDYTNHEMKMFYMERGAGASNLKMRFNLAAVKPGTVVLSKKLSGTISASNSLIEFPYQIYYKTKDGTNQYYLLTEKTEGSYNVTYKNTVTPVTFRESFTPAGGSEAYHNVFFLKPGETAVIDLPDDIVDYYIVECGVNPQVYDEVKANNEILLGQESTNSGRKDYAVGPASMSERPEVDYDNHVSDGAMRNLTITKKLYDADGESRLHYDPRDGEKKDETLFNFRLYLGTENADAEDLPLANLYSYYVKNRDGYYCRWDADQQKFVELEYNNINDLYTYLSGLPETEQDTIRFKTSMNGSITKIPADYTVEVQDLIVGTQWKVEERDYEIPKGYTLRLEDGYTRTDGKEVTYGTTPVSGTMEVNIDPAVDVRNQKGWGLTVEKVWTDKDFMEIHDPIYFAVFVKDGEAGSETYSLLEGSVRELKTTEDSIYYFFGNLQSGIPFENYTVFEVTLEPEEGETIKVDESGAVTGYRAVNRIEEGKTLTIGGQPVGGSYVEDGFSYTVNYAPGEQTTQNENVRTDTVTNSRPGIKLFKTLWDWKEPLADAVFKLKDGTGENVAAESYTSRESDGLITIAYLNPGTYTLTEIETPKGYVALPEPLTITVNEDNTIKVSGPDGFYQFIPATEAQEATEGSEAKEAEMAAITIRNREVEFKIVKLDTETNQPIADVHFALYDQVKGEGGIPQPDYIPRTGYADLVTNAEGILCVPRGAETSTPLGISDFKWGNTYYLRETEAADSYEKLPADICFTIGKDGKVTVVSGEQYTLKPESSDEGKTSYTLKVQNGKMKTVRILKTDDSDPAVPLAGAEFYLYSKDNYESESEERVPARHVISDNQGTAELGRLANDEYVLVETKAPDGYKLLENPIEISVSTDPDTGNGIVTAKCDGTGIPVQSEGTGSAAVYTISVKNEIALKKVSFKKVDIANPASSALEGAVFDLYEVENGVQKENPLHTGLTSGDDGMLTATVEGQAITIFELPVGVYHLIETAAPAGYNIKTDPVVVTVTAEKAPRGVSYDEGTALSSGGAGIGYDEEAMVYTLLISNSAGIELPQTGGPGTALFTAIGGILTALAGAILVLKKRKAQA